MIDKLRNKKIAVLYGGTSGEREVSLRSGKRVYDSLILQGLNAVLIDTQEDFIPRLKEEKIDLACIMLHGRGGEDGSLQGLLEILKIPYTGTGILGSALGINKAASKKIWQSQNIPTPKFVEIYPDIDLATQAEKIKKTFAFPFVIKPVCEGSSLGVTILKNDSNLLEILKQTIEKFGDAFIEEFISGTEVTVGVLGTGNNLQALPILELRSKNEFYDFNAKYTKGMTQFIIPARLPKIVYSKTQEVALKAFKAISCRGFARIDMIVDSDGTPFVHDANTIPGMTDLSDLPAQAQAAGISYDELVVKILESAL